MTEDCTSAPKADALPGCATPRPGENLRSLAVEPLATNTARGNGRQYKAGTDAESPEVFPNRRSGVVPVAALYVETDGCYFGLPGVDPWDIDRDARLYAGPYPVVAHPPCQRWGKLWAGQPLFIKRTGIRKVKGDDGGCFKAALASIRQWGGVIEHPWQSHAWTHFHIPVPPRVGGWIETGDGGWTCCVEQRRYGHYARKPTMLLVYGVHRADLPELAWGIGERQLDPAVVERMGLKRAIRLGEVGGKGGGTDSAARIGTPVPFRDLLLSIARSVAEGRQERAA